MPPAMPIPPPEYVSRPALTPDDRARAAALDQTDGTRPLLLTGGTILAIGILSAAITLALGIGRHGPHSNSGWLFLLIAGGCLPFGGMLFILGAAKWFRNRRLARDPYRLSQ
jgi:hypothetical protein